MIHHCATAARLHAVSEKVQSTLLSTAEAPFFDENHTFVATCICICLLGHVFTCFPVGVACGVVAVARAMWLVQCAASAQTICHMCAANKTYRCDSRTLWQHHVAMALPLSFLCVVYVLAFKKHMVLSMPVAYVHTCSHVFHVYVYAIAPKPQWHT